MIIYVITNKINGKQYVGQTTKPLKKRWQEHCLPSSHCRILRNAIQKYGKDSFTVEEICKVDHLDELDKKEMEFINKFNTLSPNGYNLKTGGNRSKYSEESKKKISEANKGRVAWNKGLTKELDERVGTQGISGEANPRYGKPSMFKNKKHSKESIEKIIKSKTGVPITITEKVLESRIKVAQKQRMKVLCHQNNTTYDSYTIAAKLLNVNQSNVSRVVNGQLKHIKGYTFSKVNI